MASQVTGPGVLYVNSKITSPKLSSEIFTKWYEDVHIPDIFETSGIKSAYRYYTTSQTPEAVERPYLALYPLRDVSFLQTTEFKSIPVHNDMVPSENKCIFDLADFDTRYYTNIAKHESNTAQNPRPFIVSHQFDLPFSETGHSGDNDTLDWYLQKHESSASRVRLYHLYFGRQNRMSQEEKKLAEPPQYLALLEFDSEKEVRTFVESTKSESDVPAAFSLLKAFGNTEHNF